MKKKSSNHTARTWLNGCAPQERTLLLIGRENPEAAAQIRHWRDHDLVRAFYRPEVSSFELVGATLVPDEDRNFAVAFPLYLVFGDLKQHGSETLCSLWAEKIWRHPTLPILAATLLVERSIWREAGPVHEGDFDLMVRYLLMKLAPDHPPLEFCLSDFWDLREARRRPARPPPVPRLPKPGQTIIELDPGRFRPPAGWGPDAERRDDVLACFTVDWKSVRRPSLALA